MTRYLFEVCGDHERSEADLPNDAAAWSALVTWCGEILKDEGYKRTEDANLKLTVRDGGRWVASIEVAGRHRPLAFH
jgi:hypothetical protein